MRGALTYPCPSQLHRAPLAIDPHTRRLPATHRDDKRLECLRTEVRNVRAEWMAWTPALVSVLSILRIRTVVDVLYCSTAEYRLRVRKYGSIWRLNPSCAIGPTRVTQAPSSLLWTEAASMHQRYGTAYAPGARCDKALINLSPDIRGLSVALSRSLEALPPKKPSAYPVI